VPEVLTVSDDAPAHLVLGWIDRGPARAATEAELGRALAGLHRAGAPCFGREDRRTTGSRGLPNEPTGTWAEFYASQRLVPLARLARDGGALPESACAALDDTAQRLDRIFPTTEPPARLHGDLWAGNRLVDSSGHSWLIDPAAHGGHREFDLAMMRLFGGFGADCFAAYAEALPLEPGWQERVALHQLAPLAVHAIKFGGGYVGSTVEALRQYR
jgi:fructosamine-3-kinase